MSENYAGWGLHLWGDAIAPELVTDWKSPLPFDHVENGWAVAEIPIANTDTPFNFIVHYGSFKSPGLDLSLLVREFGNDVWVVEGDDTIYDNEIDTISAVAAIGSRSAVLDLGSVDPIDRDNGLPPDWNHNARFMEILVRSYCDSDSDGVGDLQGLISRLDYLKALGINGLWLMPVHSSADHDHGYQVRNYRGIEQDYGTMRDFEILLKEAHRRGIGVIIDYVINHSASTHPLFLDAVSSASNERRDWYLFASGDPGWRGLAGKSWHTTDTDYYYGVFSAVMPDFNLRNPEVVEFHLNNLRFWLNKGVDGFRFDATSELFENGAKAWQNQPENHSLLKRIKDMVAEYTNRFIVCEAAAGYAYRYAQPSSCGRAFAFGTQNAILDSAHRGRLNRHLVSQLKSEQRDDMPIFLSNHDAVVGDRAFDRLHGDEAKYRVAASLAILTSSATFAYYGEEVGMAAGNLDGEDRVRTPMSWTDNPTTAGFTESNKPFRALSSNLATHNVASEQGVAGSLLEHYRSSYDLRAAYPVLGTGEFDLQSSRGDRHVVFTRRDADAMIAVLINLGSQPAKLIVRVRDRGTTFSQVFPPLFEAPRISDRRGSITLSVAGQSSVVLVRQ